MIAEKVRSFCFLEHRVTTIGSLAWTVRAGRDHSKLAWAVLGRIDHWGPRRAAYLNAYKPNGLAQGR